MHLLLCVRWPAWYVPPTRENADKVVGIADAHKHATNESQFGIEQETSFGKTSDV